MFGIRPGYANQLIDMKMDLSSAMKLGLDGLIMTLVGIEKKN